MSVAAGRKRDFFGTVSGAYRVGPADTGLITLVPAGLPSRIRIQTIHVEVTVPAGAELWTFQDGAGIPLVPAVSAAAVAHFDFRFGPDGVPCAVGTAFVLNITGATGARGWITWEASRTDQVVPPNYSATVLADRPVGYWRLGDPVGAVTALDSSGNGRTGTVLGGVTFGQAGAVDGNTAALFDGTTGYITSTAPIPANCTIEAWVNPSTVGPGGSYYRILSSGNNFPFEIAIGSDQGIWFFVNFVGLTPGWMLGSPGLPLPLNTWTYVAMTWDGTTLRVFVNGTQTYANAAWAGKVLQSGTVFIGSVIGGSGSFWIGKLDDVALYATALSPERIAQHYREGLAR